MTNSYQTIIICVWIISISILIKSNNAFNNARNNKLSTNQNFTETKKNNFEYIPSNNETSHPCMRTCLNNAPSMICYYKFKIENYYTMTKACHNCPENYTDCFRQDCVPADGHGRSVVVINRQLPGPSIEVCQNDLIVVDIENHMISESTTIHWHGQHQKSFPYMDGVPYVTQCPILPKTSFRYTFRAVQIGTHFWHSHLGMQRIDGCFGPLIVRQPLEENPHDSLYDYDLSTHIISLIDWEQISGMEKFLYHHHSTGDNKPTIVLINGLGGSYYRNENKTYTSVPLARFHVEQGYRYRFRIINAGYLNCPLELSIDNHTMKVISTDGNDIIPVEVDSLVTYAGERFDFVLSADKPKSLYWIRFKGLMDCDERFTKVHQLAVLEYTGFIKELENQIDLEDLNNSTEQSLKDQSNIEQFPEGFPTYDNSMRSGKQMNPLNKGTESNETLYVTMPQLSSLQKWDRRLKMTADYQIYLAYDFYHLNNKDFHRPGYEYYNVTPLTNRVQTPQFNHITMEIPSFPLLSQREEIQPDTFCNENTIQREECNKKHCQCSHGYKIPLNSVVELILIDEGFTFNANHPLHLHGYAFRVVAMERLGENVTVDTVKARDKAGLIKRNLLDPPIKDTVNVPDGGFVIIRFLADNPGYWIFHCHIEFHAEIGMALVFQVGENNEMSPVPKGFPKCGNYLPEADLNSTETSIKPECSRNNFLKHFEKILFGDYCEDQPSAANRQMVIAGSLSFIALGSFLGYVL